MAQDDVKNLKDGPLELDFEADSDFEKMEKAGKKGILGRFNTRFNDKLQNSRGQERQRNAVAETATAPTADVDDLAMRRARSVSTQRMIIPEGVIIEGSLSSAADTEIGGRVEGNITIEGRLHLAPSALISGSVRASTCKVEGLVEGKMECSEDLELGPSGRLNADILAGKRIHIAGQVYGNITTSGVLRLAATAKVTGDIRARSLSMEEGASLDGQCVMRAPSQQQKASDPKGKKKR